MLTFIPPTARITKGSPLTHAEGDANFTQLYNGLNALANLFGVALNNDGTLKNGAISSTSVFAASVLAGLKSIPVGGYIYHASVTPPSGFLYCDGSAVSRTTYAALYAIVGTNFGIGDGSTTFNLPDSQGRLPMGLGSGSGLTARTIGQTGGAETHQLVPGEVPELTYTVTSNQAVTTDDATMQTTNPQILYAGRNQVSVSYEPDMTITSDAGDGAHNNMPPWAGMGWWHIRYE